MKTETSFHGTASKITARIHALLRRFRLIARRQQLETQQVIASMVIATMLLPVFSLPVSAATGSRPVVEIEGFEPVNEKLSYWGELSRDVETSLESVTTPYRPSNWSDTRSDPSKESNSKVTKSESETKPAEKEPVPVAEVESPDEESVSAEEPESELEPVAEPAPFVAFLNQLPDNERGSVYTYENNLGAPPGQVEADSSNEAAALRIRHRAGIANFSFGIPLASLSGRGIDAGIGMTYNSRTWNKSINASGQNHFTYDVEQSWMAPGFSTGLGYLESQAVLQYKHPHQSSNFQYHTEIIPQGITDADGTRRQLSCKAFNPVFPGTYTTSCKTYGSSDGTMISTPARGWLAHSPSSSQTLNTTGYSNATFFVSYPNGMKISYSGGFGSGNSRKHYPVAIQDRNGNYIQIAYKSDQSGRIDYITDTLNRQIKFYYENDTSGNPDKLVAITIPGMNVNEELQTVRFYYESMTLQSGGFGGTSQVTAPTGPIRVLKYVYMPSTKTGYRYDYHPKYGMIEKIQRFAGMTVSDPTILTTTGTVTNESSWAWAATTEYDFPAGPELDVPKYTKRTDDWFGRTGSTPAETLYDAPEPIFGQDRVSTITIKDNGFDVVTETVSQPGGLLKETSVKQVTPGPGGFTELMSRTKYTWVGERNLSKLETTNEAGLTKATAFTYDGYNNQTSVKEYDFAAPGTLGTLLRTTETTYETGSGWINNNLTGLVKSVKSIVGGAVVSKTLFEYDNYVEQPFENAPGVMQHLQSYNAFTTQTQNGECSQWQCGEINCGGTQPPDPAWYCVTWHQVSAYDPNTAYRGNITKVGRMLDMNAETITETNSDKTEYAYDITGNLVAASLSCCQMRTYTYDQANGFAFPVSQTSGTSPQLTTSATYNRNTGLILTSTNENGQTTQYQYEEDTLRPKKTIYPNYAESLIEYSDKLSPGAPLPGFVRQTTTLDTNKTAQSYSYFDGRGLGIRSAKQTPDGWTISAVEYDKLGRVRKSFNPFYGGTPVAAVPGGTKYAEMTEIDGFGRPTKVTLQDNTFVTTEFSDVNTTPANFPYTFVTTTDQAGKKRRQVADALGRIVRVDEPDANGSLGAVDASLPNQQTSYEYDGNDNLVKVIQSDGTVTQERKFKYDSLSRLTHEKQVEANPTLDIDGVKGAVDPSKWTKFLKYDEHSRLDFAVDARGVRTTFGYDGLNRIKTVSYTGETGYITPNVLYTYDQARSQAFNTGALTRVETSGTGDAPPTATEFDYDLMGRVKKHRQYIGTQEYAMEYGYNLAGQMTSQKYPSGRIVTNSFDANGRLSGIADASRSYVSGLQYQGQAGSLSSMSLGNGTTQNFTLNPRLQMTGQELKKGADVLQKYDYTYGELDSQSVLKNNGKLESVTSHIGSLKQWTQKFKNDHIGRLKETEERRGDTDAVSYKQTFDYDRFGNMYRKVANNNPTGQQSPLPYTPIEDTDISKSTNRFTADTTYDDAGNVVEDNKFRTMSFGYDANGRMVKATKPSVPDALSVYDASGLRAAEYVNDVWRFMIYDIGGKLVAEYGGLQSTDEGGVKYALSDWQGSTRAVVGNTGNVQSRSDYSAFGESVASGTGLRSGSQGFGKSGGLKQGYALTEKDEATGLDHTWFRKNENQAGRWTSPDPYNGSMSIGDPQSFNRYSYVSSQPTNYVDPSGLNAASGGGFCIQIVTWGHYTNEPDTTYINTRIICFGGGGFGVGIATGGDCPPGWICDDAGPVSYMPTMPNTVQSSCGVNPVTGRPGLRNDPINSRWDRRPGGLGNLRPGEGGAGGFRERTGGKHDAVDIVAPVGTPIVANRGGTVTSGNTSGYGNWVVVSHGNVNTLYAHLSSITVSSGPVSQGIEIGKAGITGNANNLTGALAKEQHVHFGVFTGAASIPSSGSARFTDPAKYLNSPCPPN